MLICEEKKIEKGTRLHLLPNHHQKDPTALECTARVQIDNDGKCWAKSYHNDHADHELLFKDMNTKNNFLDDVISINNKLTDLPVQVSNRDLFTRELAK